MKKLNSMQLGRIFLFMILVGLVILSVNAWEEDATCKAMTNCEMSVTVNNGTVGSIGNIISGANCTINIFYTNDTKLVTNFPMEDNSDGTYNYTINITLEGSYRYYEHCIYDGVGDISSGMIFVGTTTTNYLSEINDTTTQINRTTEQINRTVIEINTTTHNTYDLLNLYIHHIDFNKQNNSKKNLLPLCLNCHIHTNYNRENWTEYFQNRVE